MFSHENKLFLTIGDELGGGGMTTTHTARDAIKAHRIRHQDHVMAFVTVYKRGEC